MAQCSGCGPIKVKRNGLGGWRCTVSARRWQGNPDRPSNLNYKLEYRKHKKDRCERCPFVPEDPCQLDVHHLDGNHKNDARSNLQTLCANCHRLVTKLDRRKRKSPSSL